MMKRISFIMAALLLAVSCQACGKESAAPVQPESGQDEPQSTGKVELLYMGQASIRIVTETGKVIYIDPFAGKQYDLPADLILVTHEHYDHNKVSLIGKLND